MTGYTAKEARYLNPGDVLALPFRKRATVTSVKVGTKYVTLTYVEYPKSRVGLHDEVVVCVDAESPVEDRAAVHLEEQATPNPMSKRWRTLPEAMTGAALAQRLRMIANQPNEFTRADRAAFLQEAARRLEVN